MAGLLSVDTATGELISISHTDATPALIGALGGVYGDIRGLTYDAGEATVYGLDRTAAQVVSIDTQTGAARRMARLPNTTLDAFAYVGNSERFLVASTTTPVVGERDLMGKRFPYAEIRGTAYNPDADVLFGAHTGYGIIIEIEPDSGWKRMVVYHAVPSVEGIAYDATGGLIHAVSSSQASIIDR